MRIRERKEIEKRKKRQSSSSSAAFSMVQRWKVFEERDSNEIIKEQAGQKFNPNT